MNYSQRRSYFRAWHRALRIFEAKHLLKVQAALDAEAKRFINEAQDVGFQTAFRSFRLTDERLTSVIARLHKDTAMAFGRMTNKQLKAGQKVGFFSANFLLNITEILTRQALDLLTLIETTTKERILNILTDASANQFTFSQTADRITSEVANPARALTITRTESNRAANIAAMEAARLQNFEVTKEWISSIDSRTRRYREKDQYDHAELDGAVRELDMPFMQPGRTNGITAIADYPLDPSAPAAFTINCRCVLGFENKRDSQGRLIPKR